MIDPRLLQVLDAVARTGSYSAAGRDLGCSQPAVTQQMQLLERAIGSPVAVKVGRSMRLTEVGTILARHAGAAFRGIHAAEEEARDFIDRHAGRVRVAGFSSACSTLLPTALVHLAASRPNVQTELFVAEPEVSLPSLRHGECEIAVYYDFVGAEEEVGELVRRPLLTDQALLAVPAGHSAASGDRARLADFADETWIAGSPRARSRLMMLTHSSGFEPRLSMFVDDNVAMQALVAAGSGVGVIPGLGWQAHRNPGVKVLRIQEYPQRRVYAACWPQMTTVPAVAAMLEVMQGTAGILAASSVLPGLIRAAPEAAPAPRNQSAG